MYRVEIAVEKEYAESVSVCTRKRLRSAAPPWPAPYHARRKSTLLPNRCGLWSWVGCGDPS